MLPYDVVNADRSYYALSLSARFGAISYSWWPRRRMDMQFDDLRVQSQLPEVAGDPLDGRVPESFQHIVLLGERMKNGSTAGAKDVHENKAVGV